MEFSSGENAWSVTAVGALEDVELLADVFFFEPPDEQAASRTVAARGRTMNRLMGERSYL
jgi:hypothetical protein